MCLGRIIKQASPNEGAAFKIFRLMKEGYLAPFYNFSFLEDCWLTNKEPDAICSCNKNIFRFFRKTYNHAFHFYKKIEDARELIFECNLTSKFNIGKNSKLVIREVQYKKYIAEDKKQLVAEELFLPSKQNLIFIPCSYYYGSTFNSLCNYKVEDGQMGPGYQYNSEIAILPEEKKDEMVFCREKFNLKELPIKTDLIFKELTK